MAKVRVYELARVLNMKNKALMDKIAELGIAVRSHMSSLEDEAVDRIKSYILGDKENDIEEKRIKPTVIRRRRKTVSPDTDEEDSQAIEAADKVEEEKVEAGEVSRTQDEEIQPEITTREETEPAEEEIPEKEVEPADEKVPPKSEDEMPDSVVKRKKRVKKVPTEKPAKIIHKPETSEAPVSEMAPEPDVPSEETPEVEVSESEEVKPEERIETEQAEETTSEAAAEADAEVLNEEKPPGIETETVEPQKEEPIEPAIAPEPEEHDANKVKPNRNKKTVVEKPAKTRKKSKRAKKEAPAKIISLPKPDAVQPLSKKTPDSEEELVENSKQKKAAPPSDSQKKETPDRKKKRKKWKKNSAGATDQNDKWPKKKPPFKRKEVIEADVLYAGESRGRKGKKGAKARMPKLHKPQITTPKAIKRRIKIDDTIVLSDLAKRMGIKAGEMIAKLMMMGVMVTVNQTIDFETAELVASEFGYELEKASFEEEVLLKVEEEDDPEKLTLRPPVVTIMGHVDHGKTSLLDVIRKSRITEVEAGGITQHIGAYLVDTGNGQIVFLDTPGHEAFTAMRARGAGVTDIVVLVVAADDGVMPQTVEAINHSKAADVPIIVAVNKIDKANADPERVYRQLAELGLVSEEWGGDTIYVKVSAKQKKGIDELLEMILLQSEVLELKANSEKHAIGYVVESKLDSGRGPVATVLIKEGTLNTGDPVVCGIHYGKVRAMLNDIGLPTESAGPATPVEIIGISGVPNAGDELIAVEDEKSAKQVSLHRIQKQRSKELAKTSRLSLDKLFEKMQKGEVKDLNLVIKADVHGSIEALSDALVKLSNEEVNIRIIHSATGAISESDISLAAVSEAIVLGFNVRPTSQAQALANEEHVDIRYYDIIYNLIKDVKDAIVGMMSSTYEERVLGKAEIREVFHVPKIGAIAGSYVTDGKIQRGGFVRLVRDGVVLYDGKISSLRRFKDDVKEVMSGYECGIGVENYNDLHIGDVLECYFLEEIKPEIE